MPEISKYEPGDFCWIELGTSDSDGAKKFYAELFGWTATDTPGAPGMIYTMLRLTDKDIGALYNLTDEHKAQGVPPHWLTYISVTKADDAAEKATQLGGKVVMAPFDVMDVGRMGLIQDPQGATFAVWQAGTHIGARVKGEPRSLCWNELATTDPAAARAFYSGLFGWNTKTDESSEPYTEFMIGSRPIGGMLQLKPEWGKVPPNWTPYIMVDDCDQTADKAKALGGRTFVPPTDIPNVGRFAVIQDPQGAIFSIVRLSAAQG